MIGVIGLLVVFRQNTNLNQLIRKESQVGLFLKKYKHILNNYVKLLIFFIKNLLLTSKSESVDSLFLFMEFLTYV